MVHYFDVNLAKIYGIEASIVLGQIEYWCYKNECDNRNFHDGRYWTFNTLKGMSKMFSYMNERKINYVLTKLKNEGLIITGNYNKSKMDRTIWYSLSEKGKSILQNCKMEDTNLSNGNNKIVKCIYNKDIQNNTQKRECDKPSLEDVLKFAEERSIIPLARKFYEHYELSNWEDKDGKPINWKQKLLTWRNREGLGIVTNIKQVKNFEERKQTNLNKSFQNIDDIEI